MSLSGAYTRISQNRSILFIYHLSPHFHTLPARSRTTFWIQNQKKKKSIGNIKLEKCERTKWKSTIIMTQNKKKKNNNIPILIFSSNVNACGSLAVGHTTFDTTTSVNQLNIFQNTRIQSSTCTNSQSEIHSEHLYFSIFLFMAARCCTAVVPCSYMLVSWSNNANYSNTIQTNSAKDAHNSSWYVCYAIQPTLPWSNHFKSTIWTNDDWLQR